MPHRFYDADDQELMPGDYVHLRGWRDELFQVKGLQFPADAIIANVIPGGRLGTSTMPCRDLTRAINNPDQVTPDWFNDRFGGVCFRLVPGTMLPCGCHVRRPDYETVLCDQHLVEVNDA
jgi:hypothetical protein